MLNPEELKCYEDLTTLEIIRLGHLLPSYPLIYIKDFLSYRENDEVSADEAADADAA